MLQASVALFVTLLAHPFLPAPGSDADGQAYRFAGTHWGASSDATRASLVDHGFTFEKADGEGSLIFTGTLNDRPALVVALFDSGRLSKVLVSMPTAEAETLAVYRSLQRILHHEYGQPALDVESYDYPFAEGRHVGYEAVALRVGKAVIASRWEANGEALGLKITDKLVISAHYESQAWKEKAEQRLRDQGK
jgi:hypothetical protein